MEHGGPGTPSPAREAVLSNPDLLASTLFHLNLLDLATSCSVSRAFCAASTERVRGLNVLRWDRTIRGREAQLAETGFYFHRHILMLPDGTFCAPDVNNHSLRILDDEGVPLQRIHMFPNGAQPRGPAIGGDGRMYAVNASTGRTFSSFEKKPEWNWHPSRQTCHSLRWEEADLGWEEKLLSPDGCAVDGETLYISDSGHDRVLAVRTRNGSVRRVIGGEHGDGDGMFNRCVCVWGGRGVARALGL